MPSWLSGLLKTKPIIKFYVEIENCAVQYCSPKWKIMLAIGAYGAGWEFS